MFWLTTELQMAMGLILFKKIILLFFIAPDNIPDLIPNQDY